jgi:hypothetical protein
METRNLFGTKLLEMKLLDKTLTDLAGLATPRRRASQRTAAARIGKSPLEKTMPWEKYLIVLRSGTAVSR